MSDKPYIRVAVGVILRPDGAVLLGSRPADKPWPHWWELPGGKIEAGESVEQALIRELKEEIAIEATTVLPWVRYIHHYPRSTVELNFCKVTDWQGDPTPLESQKLAWCPQQQPIDVAIGPILPATFPVLNWLTLPSRYLISSIGDANGVEIWLQKLQQALINGVRLVQFREPSWAMQHNAESDLHNALQKTTELCHQYGAKCLINSVHPWDWVGDTDGMHLRSQDAAQLVKQHQPAPIAEHQLLGLSAHHAQDLAHAATLASDFVVIGHVLDTPSHPDEPALGWSGFAELAAQAGRPVYAIGGQSAHTLHTAYRYGAHGIAGIRQLVENHE